MNQEERIKALEEQIAELKGAKPAEPSAPFARVDPLDRVFAEQGLRGQLPEWQRDMANAVPDAVVRSLVRDNLRSAQPAAPVSEKPRGTGWVEPQPLVQPYLRECDAVAEAFDRKDRGR
jgi:hypothetical protein